QGSPELLAQVIRQAARRRSSLLRRTTVVISQRAIPAIPTKLECSASPTLGAATSAPSSHASLYLNRIAPGAGRDVASRLNRIPGGDIASGNTETLAFDRGGHCHHALFWSLVASDRHLGAVGKARS